MNIFSEIYGTYFRIAAKLLENEVTDEKTVRSTVMSDGFRDSVLFLPQKLIPNGGDWGLFTRMADGRLKRITKKAPVKVLTKLQKMWLKAKLSDPRIRLFMDDDTLSALNERLADVQPLYTDSHFRTIDPAADSDNFADPRYIANFRASLDAVKSGEPVRVDFISGAGKRLSGEFVMLKMEYSPKNGKFRVYCRKLENGRITSSGMINIGRITAVSAAEQRCCESVSLDEYFSSRKCSSPAVIRVTNERNGVERFMLEFASFEKHTVRDLETGEYTVELWYDSQDETEVLIRLLSFGPVIEILGPERLRAQAKERINRQFRLIAGQQAHK